MICDHGPTGWCPDCVRMRTRQPTPVEKITAALDKAEELLTAGESAAGDIPWPEPDYDGDYFIQTALRITTECEEPAHLIVSVINRERAQIQHARALLLMVTGLRMTWSTTGRGLADALIDGLTATWCPEVTP